jgi:hypothetical protein
MHDAKVAKLMLVLALAIFVAGCNGDRDDAATGDGDQAVVVDESGDADDWAPVSESTSVPHDEYADPDAVTYEDGLFRVRWPTNINQTRSRIIGDPKSDEGLEMVHAFASIKDDPECGYSVSVWFREPDGSAATPEKITQHLAHFVSENQLVITHQRPIRRLGMEGVALYCNDESTGILYWIETYLDKGRTLMIKAWDRGDHMFEDADVQRFFRSVEFID